jgi:hypothetical protein
MAPGFLVETKLFVFVFTKLYRRIQFVAEGKKITIKFLRRFFSIEKYLHFKRINFEYQFRLK